MKKRLIKNILSLIVLIIIILTTVTIFDLNILPNKYISLFIGGEVTLYLIALLFYNLKHIAFVIIGIILYLLSICGNLFGYYYLSKANKYIDDNFSEETYTITTKYSLIGNAKTGVDSANDLSKEDIIDYYKYGRSVNEALKEFGDYSYNPTDTGFDALLDVMYNNSYFLVASASYDYIIGSTNMLNEADFKVISEFDVDEKIKKNNTVSDSYNIYINGLDYTGIMRDYNMIATINTKTREVVLTSIPRDYYLYVPAYNMKDTLMCLGSLDSNISKEAIESLFNIKIDYTINFNTNSLVKIVDAVGGIDFCSNYDFYTTHDLTLGSYDDKGEKLHVTKGCKSYNGLEILAIARERNAFPGRDRARQENCRKILINIAKKMASTTTLTNYNMILESFNGLYTTDMNKVVLTNLIKVGLDDMNFKITEQSVNGTDGIGIGHLGTQEAWIMEPDMNTVNEASKVINKVIKAK